MGNYQQYINVIQNWIEDCSSLRTQLLDEDYFTQKSFEELKEINENQVKELKSEAYQTSFLNPSYAIQVYPELGDILSAFYYDLQSMIRDCYHSNQEMLDVKFKMAYQMIHVLKSTPTRELCLSIYRNYCEQLLQYQEDLKIKQNYNYEDSYYQGIVMNSDPCDLRYLFKYGIYISENEIKAALLMMEYDEDKIKQLGELMVDAYLKGFVVRNKESKRFASRLIQIVGYERIGKHIIEYSTQKNLISFVADYVSTPISEQAILDHSEDIALIMDEQFLELKQEAIRKSILQNLAYLKNYMGNIIMVSFGSKLQSVKSQPTAISYQLKQVDLMKKLQAFSRRLLDTYAIKSEVSYTGMAFPSVELADNFKETFEAVMDINLVDAQLIERIQYQLIDAFDQGSKVLILGMNGNRTNLEMMLQPLDDSKTQSNFMNCGADINIPAGEIYTSPQLVGSHGTLHVKEVLIDTTLYQDLTLSIVDGYTVDYDCANEGGKELLKKHLFRLNERLPIGELAMGTNTFGYVIAKKLGILHRLHTLIGEKMGPHLAIGDTCFAFQEDNVLVDPVNHKTFMPTANEKSGLRYTKPDEAYCYIHKDITIPYDEVAAIQVVAHDGRIIDIIKDGRFVLAGCEPLNVPLEELYEVS